MSEPFHPTPCGIPLGDIVRLADRFDRQVFAGGITKPGHRLYFWTFLGEALTEKIVERGAVGALPPYQERLDNVVENFLEAYQMPAVEEIFMALDLEADAGSEDNREQVDLKMVMAGLAEVRGRYQLAPCDLLDLLAWIQVAVLVRPILEKFRALDQELDWIFAGHWIAQE